MKILIAGRFALVFICAVFFLYLPVSSLLAEGPFDWHVQQQAAWQGGVEVVALWLVFAFALGAKRVVVGWVVAVFAAEFYARRHGVDLAILTIYLYIEGIFALGKLATRGLARVFPGGDGLDDDVFAAVLGVVCWALLIWGSAAVGLSSLAGIRLLTISVLGLFLVLHRGRRFGSLAVSALRPRSWSDRMATGLLAAFLLALFAKASVVIDYDSLWYGLQSEEVLVGSGNLYHSQGLVAVVHHYPKLYESLGLPFAGLGSTSLVFGLGIASWALLILTAIAALKQLGVSRTLRLWGAALIATLPALANIAVTAKGDAFSAWMLMVGILGILRYRAGLGGTWIWIALTAIALGILSRLANLPYAALLTLAVVCSVMPKRGAGVLQGPGIALAIAAAILTTAVLARNLMISGVALIAPDVLVKLQLAAGLHLHEPVGLLPSGNDSGRLPLLDGLLGILFEPAQYPHLLITWTGNFWLFVPITVLLLGGGRHFLRSREGGLLTLLLLGLSFFPMMFGYKFLVPAGDGNYFIVPLVALSLWSLALAEDMPASTKRPLIGLLASFVLAGAAISFVTGSWGPGTRALDLEMKRLPFELAQKREATIAAAGLRGVDRFFTGMSPGTRVVGVESGAADVGTPVGWWLPVQYEPVEGFGWQNPHILVSPVDFDEYLSDAGIQYVLMPKKVVSGHAPELVRAVLQERAARGSAAIAHEDDQYVVWKLTQAQSVEVALSGGGKARVELDPKNFCARRNNGVATVTWSGNPGPVAIEVKGPGESAKLWAEAGGSGSLTTGPWMPTGGKFIFRRGRDGAVMATLLAEPVCN